MLFTALLLLHCSKEYSGVGKPEVMTLGGDSTGYTTARVRGSIVSDQGKPVVAFGILVSSRDDFKTYDSLSCNLLSDNSFDTVVTGLGYHQTLYLKAWAKNEIGIGYGEVVAYKHTGSGITFNPNVHYDTLEDIDGNRYLTVMINNREWMAENLKTTRYSDGTPIPYVEVNEDWFVLSTPAYCWYMSDEPSGMAVYGAMYNWFTVATGKLCPVGWHVPDSTEYVQLVKHLGGDAYAGIKLKEKGSLHWMGSNSATNSSGFTAMPGGQRSNSGMYLYQGFHGYLWTSTPDPIYPTRSRFIMMLGTESVCYYDFSATKQMGHSVRCVKD